MFDTLTEKSLPPKTQVLIVGGGPVGFALAALLAKQSVQTVVVEADSGYCTGSRAICVSRRSQEIMGWMGADTALVAKGLPWTCGRSFYQGKEVLHFQMPQGVTQRFAPMLNIQQFYMEEFAHLAYEKYSLNNATCGTSIGHVSWNTRFKSASQGKNGLNVNLDIREGTKNSAHSTSQQIQCDYLIACDGGKSTVREVLGLKLEGMQYDGKYVIVDIEQDTQRDVERLAWFDPPSNPGSTILMHRQPGKVWRIDYQVRGDEDPVEAVKPENVLPRVQAHLDMIGETAPWTLQWISIYNAKCLTLPSYRHAAPRDNANRHDAVSGTVNESISAEGSHDRPLRNIFFAGDAAHLVPIFGVRGLNSGLDDAGNLAWKLAHVIQGKVTGHAAQTLLDSYSTERVHAARENMAYGAKSTEFMAPPHHGFALMREAALRLATVEPSVRSLINPRQTTPIEYVGSPLNHTAGAGVPMPEAQLIEHESGCAFLSQFWGECHVLLCFGLSFSDSADEGADDSHTALDELRSARVITITKRQSPQAYERCQAQLGTRILVRPDGYIAGRWT